MAKGESGLEQFNAFGNGGEWCFDECDAEGKPVVLYIDLFSGIGGIPCGLHRVFPKAKCAGYSDIALPSISTYTKHYPDAPALGNICEVDFKQFCGVRGDGTTPRITLITAGFPCQQFCAANRLNASGVTSDGGAINGIDGEKSRLFLEFLRAIIDAQPYAFIGENVSSMKISDKEMITRMLNDAWRFGLHPDDYMYRDSAPIPPGLKGQSPSKRTPLRVNTTLLNQLRCEREKDVQNGTRPRRDPVFCFTYNSADVTFQSRGRHYWASFPLGPPKPPKIPQTLLFKNNLQTLPEHESPDNKDTSNALGEPRGCSGCGIRIPRTKKDGSGEPVVSVKGTFIHSYCKCPMNNVAWFTAKAMIQHGEAARRLLKAAHKRGKQTSHAVCSKNLIMDPNRETRIHTVRASWRNGCCGNQNAILDRRVSWYRSEKALNTAAIKKPDAKYVRRVDKYYMTGMKRMRQFTPTELWSRFGYASGDGGEFRLRTITPREAEWAQGFPTDWTICGADGSHPTRAERIGQCGNAITVNIAETCAKALQAALSM